jgi:anaphase-promoting complex subunit 3
MGMISKHSEGRNAAAVKYFSQALALDPFLWSAYEEICQLGAEKEATAALHNPELDSLYPVHFYDIFCIFKISGNVRNFQGTSEQFREL